MEENVVFALAVAGLPSALVGRSSAPVSERHCSRERKTDSERLEGQRLESLVKQVGQFASSGKVYPENFFVLRNFHVCFQ